MHAYVLEFVSVNASFSSKAVVCQSCRVIRGQRPGLNFLFQLLLFSAAPNMSSCSSHCQALFFPPLKFYLHLLNKFEQKSGIKVKKKKTDNNEEVLLEQRERKILKKRERRGKEKLDL